MTPTAPAGSLPKPSQSGMPKPGSPTAPQSQEGSGTPLWRVPQGRTWQGHPSYLQTNTSRGCWVLGVMIQGATRNTTVSVKIGVPGES